MWDHLQIRRIISDLYLKTVHQPFTGDALLYQGNNIDWKDNLGLDSMQFMGLAASVNSFFNLFDMPNPPYLLASTKVDDWVDMVANNRRWPDESISFHSSGTSGQSKVIKHTATFLSREVDFLASIFADAACIISYVPSYSIYGFLFTVALPQRLGIPVLYPSEVNWQQLSPRALIVGTPYNWQWLTDSFSDRHVNCLGVSAAALLHHTLYKAIEAKNITLTEIYGATETGGVAFRKGPEKPFKLFPFWEFTDEGNLKDRQSQQLYPLMDHITQLNDDTFNLTGRKDNQVKVAGKLVDLLQVAGKIKALPNIQDCTLTAKATNGQVILQATIQLKQDGPAEQQSIKDSINALLPAHEKPQEIWFG